LAQGEPTLVGKYLTPRGFRYSNNSLDVNKPGSSSERRHFGIPKELKIYSKIDYKKGQEDRET
jgi:hypothetical protein